MLKKFNQMSFKIFVQEDFEKWPIYEKNNYQFIIGFK